MEIKIYRDPVVSRAWDKWVEKDIEISSMSKEERLELVKKYQWLFPKSKSIVNLEALYSSVHFKHNREEFKKWFFVVSGYILSNVHLGDCSYYKFKELFKKEFHREKPTGDQFSQMVILTLAILGYIKDFGSWYIYNEGSDNNRGYHYVIDKDKLIHWDLSPYLNCDITDTSTPLWETTQTQSVSFNKPGEDQDRISWTLHPDWLAERQYSSICSVQVLSEGITKANRWLLTYDDYRYYYNLSGEAREELIDTWSSYKKLRDFSIGKIGGCKDDSEKPDGKGYAGRFHSPMTNMKSEHRHKFLRLDGELITEVDISSAQPTFLGIIVYKETGVKSEWLIQALNGTFYEWIKEKTQTQEDRNTIKKWMMQYLYSCYQAKKGKDYNKPHHPTYENKKTDDPYLSFHQRLNKFLKETEPVIFNKIDWYKRHPEFREDKTLYKTKVDKATGERRKRKAGEGKWCSLLSYDLVKMEVEYIKRCIHRLPEDMKFWTIHDCICVKESDSIQVKEIMEQVSREMYGDDIVLRLKRENTSTEIP